MSSKATPTPKEVSVVVEVGPECSSSSSSTSGSLPRRKKAKKGKMTPASNPDKLNQPQQPCSSSKELVVVMPTGCKTVQEIVDNVVKYVVITAQYNKIPITKTYMMELMNNQHRDFRPAIRQAAQKLEETFAIRLFGIRKLPDQTWVEERKLIVGKHFIVASTLPRVPLITSESVSRMSKARQILLHLILHSLYIIDKDLEEDAIWLLLVKYKLLEVCPRRDDLRQFMKIEVVNPMYAVQTETRLQETSSYRYSWGIRAELECNKFELLKHIALTVEKPMSSFTKHYNALRKDKRYSEQIAELSQTDNVNSNDSGNAVEGHDLLERNIKKIAEFCFTDK